MDRFTINTKEGELHREYVVQRLYSSENFDPHNGKTCVRAARLATKDVNDHIESLKVRQNRKTSLLEADDDNENRAMGELRRTSILSATIPLGKIANEIGKQNKVAALTHVPELLEGILSIRPINEKHLEQSTEKVFCEKGDGGFPDLVMLFLPGFWTSSKNLSLPPMSRRLKMAIFQSP